MKQKHALPLLSIAFVLTLAVAAPLYPVHAQQTGGATPPFFSGFGQLMARFQAIIDKTSGMTARGPSESQLESIQTRFQDITNRAVERGQTWSGPSGIGGSRTGMGAGIGGGMGAGMGGRTDDTQTLESVKSTILDRVKQAIQRATVRREEFLSKMESRRQKLADCGADVSVLDGYIQQADTQFQQLVAVANQAIATMEATNPTDRQSLIAAFRAEAQKVQVEANKLQAIFSEAVQVMKQQTVQCRPEPGSQTSGATGIGDGGENGNGGGGNGSGTSGTSRGWRGWGGINPRISIWPTYPPVDPRVSPHTEDPVTK